MKLEADTAAKSDPVLAAFMYSTVINRVRWKIASSTDLRTARSSRHAAVLLRQTFEEMLPTAGMGNDLLRVDIQASMTATRPAPASSSRPLFQGLPCHPAHRLAHWLWLKGRKDFAALSAKPLVQRLPDGYRAGRSHRRGLLPRPLPPAWFWGRPSSATMSRSCKA